VLARVEGEVELKNLILAVVDLLAVDQLVEIIITPVLAVLLECFNIPLQQINLSLAVGAGSA